MKEEIILYDIAIIGGGPAGLAAAVNARRRNKQTVLLTKEENSSKLVQSNLIDNYLGLPQITGRELAQKMKEHAEALGTVFLKDEVQNIYHEDDQFNLFGRENSVSTSSVIITVGVVLGSEIQGETEWIGRGVSYCATCDGMFFKGKTVAMIGYIPEAESQVKFLAEICSKVYYIPQYKLEAELDPRVTLLGGKPLAITGGSRVELVKTAAGEWPVDGVFIERAGRPVDQIMEGLRLENGFIITNSDQSTNLAGVFAAGDCTGKPWQINRAVGQGQVAALSAVHYLDSAHRSV